MWPVVAILLAILIDPVPTPETNRVVNAIVGDLAHPRFAVREKASKALLEIGSPAKPALWQTASKAGDPEAIERALAIHAKIIDRELDSLRPFPFIDAWWFNVTKRVHVYEDRWRYPMQSHCLEMVGNNPADYSACRRATELWARKQLLDGVNVRMLRLTLAAMHHRDGSFVGERSKWFVNWRDYLRAGK